MNARELPHLEELDEDEGWATFRVDGVSRTVPMAQPAPRPRRARWVAVGLAAAVAAGLVRRRR